MSPTDRTNYRRIKRRYANLPRGEVRALFLDNVGQIEEYIRMVAAMEKARMGLGHVKGEETPVEASPSQ